MNYYQFHLGDYVLHTAHLSLLEDLAYRRLIDLYYTTEAPICLDTEKVSKLIRMREHADVVADVLNEFFVKHEDGYRSKRCDAEIAKYKAMVEGGKRGGDKRWNREANTPPIPTPLAKVCPPYSPPNSNQEPITNNQEPVTSINAIGSDEPEESPRKKFSPLAALLEAGVDEQIASDFVAHRRSMKAPLTETALNGLKREAAKARIALSDALAMSCERGWRSFKAEWYEKELGQKFGPAKSMRDLNQEAIARSLFGHLEPPMQQLPERVIDGELL